MTSRRETAVVERPARAKRPTRSGPRTTPVRRQAPASSTRQAQARAKARKAKAPKPVREPLRERLITRLASIDLRPQTLVAKVPFVVLVIGSLGIGLALTLWLSTDSAERSYQLGNARERNRVLSQQKESLEREVLEAQAAPALAEAARNLGMIPSRDTAHLVQDPAGNWVVVGEPKPAEGAPPPPLNTPLPDPTPPPPPVNRTEVPVMVTRPAPAPAAAPAPTSGAAVIPPAAPEVVVRAPVIPVPTGPLPGPAGSDVAGPAAAAPVAPDAPQPANAPAAPPAPEQSNTVAVPTAVPPT